MAAPTKLFMEIYKSIQRRRVFCSLEVSASINAADYILVPQKNVVIAKRQLYNGLQWEQSIRATAEHGLRLPRIDEFMQHFLNVREAAEGRDFLHDATGAQLDQDEARDHWNYLSSTDRKPFGDKIFWTWLDAHFKERNNELYMETDHRVARAGNNSNITSRQASLDAYVKMNGLVGLNFNNQGLPTSASQLSQYAQGQNIYFWPPVKDRVAGFSASSGRANLDCVGGPQVPSPVLGVLACAEGTAPQKNAAPVNSKFQYGGGLS